MNGPFESPGQSKNRSGRIQPTALFVSRNPPLRFRTRRTLECAGWLTRRTTKRNAFVDLWIQRMTDEQTNQQIR